MKTPLQILHLEDNRTDAEVVGLMLDKEGIDCEIRCVRTRAEFGAALSSADFDLIISDLSLPQFNGLAALKMAQQQCPAKPFIFVSGTMGEEAAVESLKEGAADYVLKDRLQRLGPAVKRAVQDAEDRAEKKELEAQSLRAQRREIIGALAGGIAHDLNNALVPILVGVELLGMEPAGESLGKMLEAMRASAQRASEMVKQILSFARGVAGEPVLLRVEQLLGEMERLATQTFPKSIRIQTKIGKDLYPILGNATQLHQVLLNLCINARDAMPDGGSLLIQARNTLVEQKITPWQPQPVSGPHVVLAVSDTGQGMSPEVLGKIFEPFFSTKETSKGTGLGLSTVQAIVKSHGGFVEVSSQPGKGTTFSTYFPAAGPVRQAEQPAR